MPDDPVILAIDTAIQSLKKQPNQFNLSVIVTGLAVSASGGGTGMHVQVQGGGPGSQTTGVIARADGTQLNIAQRTADAALLQQGEQAVALLTEIKGLLQAPKIDKPVVKSKLLEFTNTYVAPAVKSIIEMLVKMKLGF